ncbi:MULTISPECIES: hypothetical protein [unclassified Streptomyces]|uniref:hypothetical protein n=1 Tax=unclassified Streptomyces TaxID=2593676 RepID=UPI0036FB5CDA
MSASEKSEQNPSHRTGPYAVPDHPGPYAVPDHSDPEETYGPGGVGEPHVLPAPFAEHARTAALAARGTGNRLRTAVYAHKAVSGGAAVGAGAALGLVYALGRRSGRRAARSGLGPVALFLERRL